jgi:hypothetical protein
MLRGRCSCAISGRPGTLSGTQTARPTPSLFATSSLLCPLTPLFPLHTRHSPVSPIISTLAQNIGGGGCPLQNALAHNSFVFSRRVNSILNYMSNYIVGAPTFSSLRANTRPGDRTASLLRWLGGRRPHTNFEPSTFNFAPVSSFFSDLLLATSLPAAASAQEGHSPLSLIIPVHPRNAPVSPIIPVHTQKQGGGTLRTKCVLL